MKGAYLEVTYRKGRALAAYYYLPRQDGDRSARTDRASNGILVDYAADGRAIGLEITQPSTIGLSDLNAVLEQLGQPAIGHDEFAPLAAA